MTDDVLKPVAERLVDDIDAATALASVLPDDTLRHLAAAIRDEVRGRARASGDHDAIIEEAFEQAFGRDGLGSSPWVSGDVIVCPGSIVAKNRSSHRCRFVSVDDVWIWDSQELIREEKQSHPGRDEGFKAVALLPLVEDLHSTLSPAAHILASTVSAGCPMRSGRANSSRSAVASSAATCSDLQRSVFVSETIKLAAEPVRPRRTGERVHRPAAGHRAVPGYTGLVSTPLP